MNRDLGEGAIVADLPAWVELLAVAVTLLGDTWFVFALLGACYWFGTALPKPVSLDRRRAAFGVALGIGALTATTAAKQWFRYPRPSAAIADPRALELVPEMVQPLYLMATTAEGFGFPSGHTVAAVLVYGGLALLVGSRRAYVTAALVVPAVAASRVLLEVHYLADILVGFGVGAVYLAVVYLLCARGQNPGRALMVALLVAVVGAIIGGYGVETMGALGATIGARIAWGSLGDAVVHAETTRIGGGLASVVGAAFGALFAVVYLLQPAPHVAFVVMGVVLAGVIAAPLIGESVASRLDASPPRSNVGAA